MNLEDYPNEDGKKVWLSEREVEQLLDAIDDTIHEVAVKLGVRCGLRTHEIVQVAPEDVADTNAGTMLRVWESAKTDHYRETPIPPAFANTVRTIDGVREEPADAPLVGVSKHTLRCWIEGATDTLQEETGEPGWQFVGYHGLRRTQTTQLRSADVDAMVLCDRGGWNDLDTFLDHYRGTPPKDQATRVPESRVVATVIRGLLSCRGHTDRCELSPVRTPVPWHARSLLGCSGRSSSCRRRPVSCFSTNRSPWIETVLAGVEILSTSGDSTRVV